MGTDRYTRSPGACCRMTSRLGAGPDTAGGTAMPSPTVVASVRAARRVRLEMAQPCSSKYFFAPGASSLTGTSCALSTVMSFAALCELWTLSMLSNRVFVMS